MISPLQSKRSRITKAALDLAWLTGFVAIGVYAGPPLARWSVHLSSQAPAVPGVPAIDYTRAETAALGVLFAYFIAAWLLGVGLMMKRLPGRVVVPLGDGGSWFALLVGAFLTGTFTLPFVAVTRVAKLVWVIVTPSPPLPSLGVVYTRAEPGVQTLEQRRRSAQPVNVIRGARSPRGGVENDRF
jgi:hypothetical protein